MQNHNLESARLLMKKHFGYSEFRPAQEKLITWLLSGEDALGIMPTGAGKSMCYQLPALMLPGITLVISPLISLMQDQVRALKEADIAGAYLNSALTFRQYLKALDNARAGMYKIIYVAPERLATAEFRQFAASVEISMIAVDEAHCISQWGHDFRPSYIQIASFVKQLPKRPVLAAFTATATDTVKDDIIQRLELVNPHTIVTGFDRENLYFEISHPSDKKSELLDYVKNHSDESGIVYCSTRKNVEMVTSLLKDNGYLAGRYHAGLDEEERRLVQNDFLYDRLKIIVATNAFGMGIDKKNVRYVLHYNMPKNMESYYQEAGRAGRDGSKAECMLYFSSGDVFMAEFLINKSYENSESPAEMKVRQKQIDFDKLDKMKAYATSNICLRHRILEYFGEESPLTCNNCSICNSKSRIMSALRSSQKAYTGRKEKTLYEMLKAVRTDFSQKNQIPPELVFSDRTLEAMAAQKPETEYDMLQIPGVSYAKYQRYGKVFLRVIQRNRHRESGV